ncbi:putative multicopper oxidase, type 1, multicopper oxidase, copper-binding, cupredoxin [Septoria linicola]|nr:putative multicopper oxidase, type 1, multicopper oxidase, copper-binding, cupredoxin [Septoria linicola]
MLSPITLLACLLTISSSALAATRRFAIEASWGSGAPDGFERQMILVNGTSPGPALIVDQGDDVEFYMHNGLDLETTIHFHGIEQLHTPWSDGVPGLSQRPVAPGAGFLYKWRATESGAYWYHAHYQSQVSDGLYGPIYIRPSRSQPKPFDRITSDSASLNALMRAEDNPQFVMVTDWQHVTSNELMAIQNRTNIDVYCAQSMLFNGHGAVNCLTTEQQRAALAPPFQQLYGPQGPLAGSWFTPSGCAPFNGFTQNPGPIDPAGLPQEVTGCRATNSQLSDFRVNPAERWANFHLMSANSILAPVISLDGHDMWVYAVDGRYIEPYRVQGLQFYSGERYSVMIPLNQAPGTYTFRASHFGFNQLLSGYATVTYESDDSGNGNDGGSSGSDGGKPPSYGKKFVKHGGRKHKGSRGFDLNIPAFSDTASFGKDKRQSLSDAQAYFTYGGWPVSQNVIQLNETGIIPFPNVPPARDADATFIFQMSRFQAPWMWTVTGQAAYPAFPKEYAEDDPLLYFPNGEEAHARDLVVRTQNNTWVDLVFAVTDMFGPPHPMHKHSNKAYVIGRGTGNWTWNSVAEAAAAQPQSFNFDSPQLRDGYATQPSAGQPVWLVVRYHVVNPGAFMLHCHIQTHLAGGMAVAMLDAVEHFPEIPEEYSIDRNGT